jgi:hypothetical protein
MEPDQGESDGLAEIRGKVQGPEAPVGAVHVQERMLWQAALWTSF